MYLPSTSPVTAVVCVCRPASAVCSARVAAEEPDGSRADAPAAALPEEDSAAAVRARSAVVARVPNVVLDDSSPAADSLVEDSVVSDSFQVVVAADCSDSDTRNASAAATGDSILDDSCLGDCWAQADSSPDDSVASQADARCVPVARPDGCCPGDCCPAGCSEPAGSVAGDNLAEADLAQAD